MSDKRTTYQERYKGYCRTYEPSIAAHLSAGEELEQGLEKINDTLKQGLEKINDTLKQGLEKNEPEKPETIKIERKPRAKKQAPPPEEEPKNEEESEGIANVEEVEESS